MIVCPEMIAPSEWLPLVWGEDAEPSFDTLSDYQAVLDLIMEHYIDRFPSASPAFATNTRHDGSHEKQCDRPTP